MKGFCKVLLAAAAIAALAAPAMAADKLVVKDAAGTNTTFVVQDTGNTGIGYATPGSKLDVRENLVVSTANQTTPVVTLYNNALLRTKNRIDGVQEWYMNSGSAEVGAIKYSTPGGGPGIGFFTGATYDQNQFNIANYPTLGTGGAAIAGLGYTAGTGIVTIDKTTGNVGIGPLYSANPPTDKLDVNGNSIRIRTAQSPVSTAACNAGAIAWDTANIYVCTASGAWKKAALSAY